ncbi:hypothetical protein EMA8858_01388 [Emticicia aquatica]|uniref:YD repeat-containing protein n=1 Tax=Emticicia aquatica TaxID=1681835 RepID=A0ABM9ANR4_9BACT|nr:hypothetical protein [Emticicia aquatica]CAH0995268.1 hypothetical protein EMA8858_01388 [Emticicia aquatica]
MKIKLLTFLSVIILLSCQKDETKSICRLTKFVTEYPVTSIIHHDLIFLKNNRIEKIYSYDLKNLKDTSARQRIYYEYNSLGNVSIIRDESNINRIIKFEFIYGAKPYADKIVQTTSGVVSNEIILEFDSKNRPTGAVSLNLVGLNRTIEYDANGNPFRITRADFGSPATVNEHTFDNKRNFFEGIPDIGVYWLLRPLYGFIPFGNNNIISTKYYTIQNREFKEVPDLRTIRETNYNENGFPTEMTIFLESQGKSTTSISKFEYNCE